MPGQRPSASNRVGASVDGARAGPAREVEPQLYLPATRRCVGSHGRHDPPVVQAWIAHLADARPFLIVGRDFHEFYAENLAKKKTRLAQFEVLCLTCKAARTPLPGLVDAEPMDASRDRIMALCPVCSGLTRRIISRSELRKWGVKYGFAPSTRECA